MLNLTAISDAIKVVDDVALKLKNIKVSNDKNKKVTISELLDNDIVNNFVSTVNEMKGDETIVSIEQLDTLITALNTLSPILSSLNLASSKDNKKATKLADAMNEATNIVKTAKTTIILTKLTLNAIDEEGKMSKIGKIVTTVVIFITLIAIQYVELPF